MLFKVIGVWLFLDGFLSLFLCSDKKISYQIPRVIRFLIGIVIFILK